jgi:hypothetical protein
VSELTSLKSQTYFTPGEQVIKFCLKFLSRNYRNCVTGDLSSSCIYIYVCVCVGVGVCVRERERERQRENFLYMRDLSNFSTDKNQMISDRAKEEVKKDK